MKLLVWLIGLLFGRLDMTVFTHFGIVLSLICEIYKVQILDFLWYCSDGCEGSLETSSDNAVPPIYITKYNRFVDSILERINRILRKNYDPVNVHLHNNNNKKNSNSKHNSNKKNKKRRRHPTASQNGNRRPGHRSEDITRSTT